MRFVMMTKVILITELSFQSIKTTKIVFNVVMHHSLFYFDRAVYKVILFSSSRIICLPLLNMLRCSGAYRGGRILSETITRTYLSV